MTIQTEAQKADLYAVGYTYGFELAKFHYETLGYFPPDEFQVLDAIACGYRSYVASIRRRIAA